MQKGCDVYKCLFSPTNKNKRVYKRNKIHIF